MNIQTVQKTVYERAYGCDFVASVPPNTVRNNDKTLRPANGYRWLNDDLDDFRVRPTSRKSSIFSDPEFRKKAIKVLKQTSMKPKKSKLGFGEDMQELMEQLIRTENGFYPAKGYSWVNPNDPKDLLVVETP